MPSKPLTKSHWDPRNFLKGHTSYDVFPVSFRIIVLDNKLEIKKALHVLLANCESLWAVCRREYVHWTQL